MEPYHLTPSRCGWRMFYDLQYQESMCKCCHRCSQEAYDASLPSLQHSYALGLHLVPRAKSPVNPSLPYRRPALETSKIVEERKERKERLKFSVDAILGIKREEEEDRSGDQDDASSHTPTTHDAESKKTSGRSPAFTTKRAVFSDYQRRQLEQEFLAHKYINKQERKQLSARLCLTESQIRIWFQNRRMKWRNWQEREIMRRKRHATLEQL